ncbi:MAG TPA: DegT/DnrJ/EryC1/StrS family aminotransferase, partial [Actinomycetota bacterium]|nr:DegT/DnrJ/EryC1/StrS family aminotransferase [Actinomycetota bacterium]
QEGRAVGAGREADRAGRGDVAGPDAGGVTATSAISFAASANCAAFLGATPRFADVDPDTINIDPVSLLALGPVKAVVPVDFAGLPIETATVVAAAGEAVVIEDAAHGLGARYADGSPVGSCPRGIAMTAFSFHPVKSITTGEGGAVTTNDPALADTMRRFRHHGIERDRSKFVYDDEGPWYHEMHDLGFNYRITDFQCALGLTQLRKLDAFVEARNEVAAMYRERLASIDEITLPAAATGNGRHAYHLFAIRVPANLRRAVFEALRADGLGVQVHYLPIYRHPWYRETFGYRPGLCPGAEAYYAGAISIPVYPGMSKDDVERVARSLEAALRAG